MDYAMNEKLDKIMDEVTEQVAWDLKRGAIDTVDRDYIAEVAEDILSPDDYELFSENDCKTYIYQNAVFD